MKTYDLTNPQDSIWKMEEYYNGTNINNICGTLTIKKDVDLDVLNNAVNIFIENNKSFGLNFKVENGKPVQFFTETESLDYERIYLKDNSALKDYANKTASEVFDIYGKRLYKFVLFKLENGYGGFIVLTHHIISDAGTFGLIGTEIAENYRRLTASEEIEKKDYSYEDYINTEKEYMESPKFKKDEEYWNTLYADVPEVASIPSMNSKTNLDFKGTAKRKSYLIGNRLCLKIAKFCEKYKVSNYNFFMAIYAIYLGKVSDLSDFVIGTPILNRANFKEKHTTGMFINTAPLRIKLDNETSFSSFVKQIAKDSLSMLRYQRYSYDMLLENLRKKYSSLPNLYDVMISYQITKAHDKNIDLPYEVEWFGATTISNGMYIHLHDNNDEENLNIAYDYQIQKYDEEDIENMHKRILHIIKQVLENEEILEKNIEIVTPEEKSKILGEFNDTFLEYDKNKTIIDYFEEQVEKTPDNIALVFEDKKLTYKELNEKANMVAKELISNNVQYKDVVAVFLPRSIELIISIWGILKCGATYMPIYVGYPIDRINYMIKNSNAKITLTNSEFKDKLENTSNIIINSFNNIDPINHLKHVSSSPNDIAYIIYTSGSTRQT